MNFGMFAGKKYWKISLVVEVITCWNIEFITCNYLNWAQYFLILLASYMGSGIPQYYQFKYIKISLQNENVNFQQKLYFHQYCYWRCSGVFQLFCHTIATIYVFQRVQRWIFRTLWIPVVGYWIYRIDFYRNNR